MCGPNIRPTCAQFGEHLHGIIKSFLAKQVKGVEILDVMNLLLLVPVRVVLHLLTAETQNEAEHPAWSVGFRLSPSLMKS